MYGTREQISEVLIYHEEFRIQIQPKETTEAENQKFLSKNKWKIKGSKCLKTDGWKELIFPKVGVEVDRMSLMLSPIKLHFY